ncbi:MAG: CpsD/CapB family tyrosine-protein kinase [Clostridia bacterium]|nr:CpsD/CapB family tyrosine-protein kinase [Clostridia bacterium]
MGLNKLKDKTNFSPATEKKTLHRNLSFTATEQYKLLRANLEFTLPQDEKCHVIGVTSSTRGEGKSTTAINLSYVLAEKGSKVLLIDADLRIPSVAKKMGIASTPGLTNLLIKKDLSADIFKTDVLDTWYILPAGDIPPNPSELLGSARMEELLISLKQKFDYIVVDLPPVNLVSDAVAISKFISGMIVVIREEYTEKKELTHCMRQLSLSNVNVLGCVMNETDSGRSYYGKYKKYSYYYQSEGSKGKPSEADADKTDSAKADNAKTKKNNKRKSK